MCVQSVPLNTSLCGLWSRWVRASGNIKHRKTPLLKVTTPALFLPQTPNKVFHSHAVIIKVRHNYNCCKKKGGGACVYSGAAGWLYLGFSWAMCSIFHKKSLWFGPGDVLMIIMYAAITAPRWTLIASPGTEPGPRLWGLQSQLMAWSCLVSTGNGSSI